MLSHGGSSELRGTLFCLDSSQVVVWSIHRAPGGPVSGDIHLTGSPKRSLRD